MTSLVYNAAPASILAAPILLKYLALEYRDTLPVKPILKHSLPLQYNQPTPTTLYSTIGNFDFEYACDAVEFARYMTYCETKGQIDYTGLTNGFYCSIQAADKRFEKLPIKIESKAPSAPTIPKAKAKGLFQSAKRSPDTFKRLSFHTGKLNQDVLLFCEITGIAGKMEMPFLPIALDYMHPIAYKSNALRICEQLFPDTEKKEPAISLERQVLAGLVLSLLNAKHKLPEASCETTAAERNLILQSAGEKGLAWLLLNIYRQWDNQQAWLKLPSISLIWQTMARNPGEVLPALNSYAYFLRNANRPEKLDRDQISSMYLSIEKNTAGKAKANPQTIQIKNVEKLQHSILLDQKKEALEVFSEVKRAFHPSLQGEIKKTIGNLIGFSMEHKEKIAMQIRASVVGTANAEAGNTLAKLLEAAETGKIEQGLESIFDGEAKPALKGIAAILAAKQAKRLATS